MAKAAASSLGMFPRTAPFPPARGKAELLCLAFEAHQHRFQSHFPQLPLS